jgi:hypothetical protein
LFEIGGIGAALRNDCGILEREDDDERSVFWVETEYELL